MEGVALAEKGTKEASLPTLQRGLTEIQAAAQTMEGKLAEVTNLGDPSNLAVVLTARAWAKAIALEPTSALRPVTDAPMSRIDVPVGTALTRPVGYAVVNLWAEVYAAAATKSWAEARRQRALTEAALLGVALGPFGIIAAIDRLGIVFPEVADLLGIDDLRRMRDDAMDTMKTLAVVGVASAAAVGALIFFLRR